MSSKYKFRNSKGIYFVSFATVFWIDVFIREQYFQCILENLQYCQKHKGMHLQCWCIMPSHLHLIFSAEQGNPSGLLRDFKGYTSKRMLEMIHRNHRESRREWILEKMTFADTRKSGFMNRFWQHDSHPIEIWSIDVFRQKVNYIHQNPVKAGFVCNPWEWKYSSAKDYYGMKGELEVDIMEM